MNSDNNPQGKSEEDLIVNEVQYEKMSLRHEKVQSSKAQAIEVIFFFDKEALAREVGYGIEEEGLPHILRSLKSDDPKAEAYKASQKQGLGVSVGIDAEGKLYLFARMLKKEKPFIECMDPDAFHARTFGKNAAKIIKNRPLIL